MADTAVETVTPGAITITYTGAGAAWNSKTNFPGGVKLKAIKFYPSAANDILMVRNGSATAGTLAEMKDVLGGGLADRSFGEGVWCNPYLLVADQTFNDITAVKVMFIIA